MIGTQLSPSHPAAAFDPREVLDHPSGYFALSPRNSRFTVDGLRGFIAYRDRGRRRVFLGGVHAEKEHMEPLLDAFTADAEKSGRGVVGVQIPQSQAGLFRSRGFTVSQFGSTYALFLPGFSFNGSRRLKLRNKIKRAREAGLRIFEVGRDIPSDERTFERLQRIGHEWLLAKKKQELDFMIGELGGPEDRERRIFVVVTPEGGITGFITYVPVWGARPGYLHDLTRRLPGTPAGAMELCNAHAMEQLAADGAAYLHFGFTPFVVDDRKGEGDSALLFYILRLLGRYGEAIYPSRRQADYKMKWAPGIVEREYIAFKPFSLPAVMDLLILTRSI